MAPSVKGVQICARIRWLGGFERLPELLQVTVLIALASINSKGEHEERNRTGVI
jgi:hypothetical protein